MIGRGQIVVKPWVASSWLNFGFLQRKTRPGRASSAITPNSGVGPSRFQST